MTKHNWRILKDLHQTDTFSVTYLAFTGIPILMDVTHHLAHVSLSDSLCASSVPKAVACCSILRDGRKENILMLLKRDVQLFFAMG